jgi:hypothetical protein
MAVFISHLNVARELQRLKGTMNYDCLWTMGKAVFFLLPGCRATCHQPFLMFRAENPINPGSMSRASLILRCGKQSFLVALFKFL